MSRRRSVLALLLLVGAALLFVGARWWRPESSQTLAPVGSALAPRLPQPRRAQRLGGLDVTFFVSSDTHLGFESSEHETLGGLHDPVANPRGVERINAQAIAAMNAMPGTAWPSPLTGTIDEPRGVLICGDLTEDGDPWQWHHFTQLYGLRGDDGQLRYPVFEAYGNHDKHHSWYVLDRVRERHGGYRYAFDWHDLHLVNLGEAPDDDGLTFLAKDLEEVGRERPVVVYLHFPMQGPYSDNWFGRGNYRERLAAALEPYNVVAMFHGHYHASGRYVWNGLNVYNVGAAKHLRHSFAAVRITDTSLRIASYHHGMKAFQWWHEVPINGSDVPERHGGTRADRGLMFGSPAD